MGEKKLWFKNKRYGWGWYPASWEGWVVLLVWVFFFAIGELLFLRHMESDPSTAAVIFFVLYVALAVGILITVCYIRGEKPRWRFGEDEK